MESWGIYKVVAITSVEQWNVWAQEGWSMLPYGLRVDGSGALPLSWRKAWEMSAEYAFVLESGKEGRYTYLGLDPVSVIRGKGNSAVVNDLQSDSITKLDGTPLDLIENWMSPYRSPSLSSLPKFSGGAVGYLSYDVARSLERIPRLADDDLKLPDYVWMRMEQIWIVDHVEEALYCVVHVPIHNDSSPRSDIASIYMEAECRAKKMVEQWRQVIHADIEVETSNRQAKMTYVTDHAFKHNDNGSGQDGTLTTSLSEKQYQDAVIRIQQYIAAGDVFQVNLSLRQERRLVSSPEQIYEWLRLLNPSPYMGLLKCPDFQLVSASPELLVKLEQGRVGVRPIAGTRRRGSTAEEDVLMANELRTNEKEKAEHIMLVDLARNDIGRIAEFGTVQVSELLAIEYYSHVMHLVSQVEGKLAAGKTAYDAIAACFPGGTITGAPKVRTMEIIEELEPVTRGPYTGSMGWIDYSGNMELNIIIRTLIVQNGIGYIQAGAGIVIDSDPYREFKECHNKAKAIAKAVELSEEFVLRNLGQEMVT